MAGLVLVKDEADMDKLDNIQDADLLAELEAMKAWVGNWYVFGSFANYHLPFNSCSSYRYIRMWELEPKPGKDK